MPLSGSLKKPSFTEIFKQRDFNDLFTQNAGYVIWLRYRVHLELTKPIGFIDLLFIVY